MADSSITKGALSKALKELLEGHSFEKISVSDICDKCNMNRKSFYYHFKDKYDLANWIFDTEFIALTRENSLNVLNPSPVFEDRWHGLWVICQYFYENRNFYRKLLLVEGQNSFSGHFREFLGSLLGQRVADVMGNEPVPPMVLGFVIDGLGGAFERWLTEKDCATAEEFMHNVKQLLNLLILGLGRRIQDDPTWLEQIQK